ncbi:transglutaminase-like domain-containing protein [Vibrio sp. PNB22_4_1]
MDDRIEQSNSMATVLDLFRFGILPKIVASATAFCFASVFYFLPTAFAVANEINRDAEFKEQRDRMITQHFERTAESKLAYRLQSMKEAISQDFSVSEDVEEKGFVSNTLSFFGFSDLALTQAQLDELLAIKQDVVEAYNEASIEFEHIDGLLESGALDSTTADYVASQHLKAVEYVSSEHNGLLEKLDRVLTASDYDSQVSALVELDNYLESQQFSGTHTPADMDSLPWATPSSKVSEPGYLDIGFNPMQLPTELLSLSDAPSPRLFMVEQNEYLGETTEIQFTDEIKALALSLNHNPTEIYAWVHNNILYTPSFGSIQGAQLTLDTKKGNAIDTASLLISLLRASGIPARYAYGTVEIPATKVMNWVGNVESAEAALNLMGQGGIPSIGMISGGQITNIRLDHTWVEAWVDYEPSRGVKNISGDAWIPMDASFKQYDYSEGIDIASAVPLDAEQLVTSLESDFELNNDQGWMQAKPAVVGTEQEQLRTFIQDFERKVEQHLETAEEGTTFGELLGLSSVKVKPPHPLASGLPYHMFSTSGNRSFVPENLQHKFKYELSSKNAYDTAISYLIPTAAIGGQKLTLSFAPSTAEDQALIDSYGPPDNVEGDNANWQPPAALPGYLINLSAELYLDGNLISSSFIGKMGEELVENIALWSPARGWAAATNYPTSGEYRAIGLFLQGINSKQAGELANKIQSAQEVLNNKDWDAIDKLTHHDLVGDMLFGTIMNYFSLNDIQDDIQSKRLGLVSHALPSFGVMSTAISTQYWFGLPRNVEPTGLYIDVDMMQRQVVDKQNVQQNVVSFMKASGTRASAMEHIVPEQTFSTEDNPANGVSAIKLIGLAAAEGQKIWTITSENLNAALSAIDLGSAVENEIRHSVLSGKTVTAHSNQIVNSSWAGSGYVIFDPLTGSGAYKISGGKNGGFVDFVSIMLKTLSFYLMFKALLRFIASVSGRWFFLGPIIGMLGGIDALARNCSNSTAASLFSGVLVMMSLISLVLMSVAIVGIFAYIAFTLAVLAIKKLVIAMMLDTPLCRDPG